MEEEQAAAIQHACRALRRRHAEEEGAHAPAVEALSQIIYPRTSGLMSKTLEGLKEELVKSLQARARASQQLAEEVLAVQELHSRISLTAEFYQRLEDEKSDAIRTLKELEAKQVVSEKFIDSAQYELVPLRMHVTRLEQQLSKQVSENDSLLNRMIQGTSRYMEVLNEANVRCDRVKTSAQADALQQYANQHVTGAVRLRLNASSVEEGIECCAEGPKDTVACSVPKLARQLPGAHHGGCTALMFQHHSSVLLSGGHDKVIKIWDTRSGIITGTLRGYLGSVLDIAVSRENQLVLAASSEHKLFLWDLMSGRLRHTLTGHTERVATADFMESVNCRAVSAADDRTMRLWDLVKGYVINSWSCGSICTSLAGASEGCYVYSGHLDGSLRIWDSRSRKVCAQVSAHGQGVTSVELANTGDFILTTSRDNSLKLFDARHLEARGSYTAAGFRVASNWTRSCLSPDGNYVASGSGDGCVFVWGFASIHNLTAHTSPVSACVWSDLGGPLVSADKSGCIAIWE